MTENDAQEAYLWHLAAKSLRLHGDHAAASTASQMAVHHATRQSTSGTTFLHRAPSTPPLVIDLMDKCA